MKPLLHLSLAGLLALLAAGPSPAARGVTAPGQQDAGPGRAAPAAEEPPADGEAWPTTPLQQLRLRDGGLLWGWIESHTSERVGFLRLDNGGRVQLPWSWLDPRQESELKTIFGYVDLTSQEPMVLAARVQTASGDEFVGVIQNRNDQYLELKSANGLLQLPLAQLRGTIVEELVPARQIYTRDELYDDQLSLHLPALSGPDVDPAVKAEAHFELARFCESVFDFRRALVHYQAIAEADPTFTHPDLAASLERAGRRAAAQEQADVLEEIDRLRGRQLYPAAVELMQRFATLYPDSPLTQDFVRLQASVIADRERDLLEQAELRWHYWVSKLARERAKDDQFESVLAWLEEGCSADVLAAVTADLTRYRADISETEVRELWNQRAATRLRRASYGVGTWLIGRDAARAGVEGEEEQAPASDPRSEERKQLEERIQRYLRNQQVAGAGGNRDSDSEADPQAYWEATGVASRHAWIVAHYVENSGDMRVTRAAIRPCRECGGTGFLEIVTAGDGQGTRLFECPLCHGVAVVRRVSYR
jgi:hypothetical protein